MSISDAMDTLNAETVFERDVTWEECVKSLPDDDCHYFIYNLSLTKQFDFSKDVQITTNQFAFISWIPGKSSVKKRMIAASAKSVITKDLFNQKFELDWTLGDRAELDLEERMNDLRRIRKYQDIVEIK